MPNRSLKLNLPAPLLEWNEPASFVEKHRPGAISGRTEIVKFFLFSTLLTIGWILGVLTHPEKPSFILLCLATFVFPLVFVYSLRLINYYSSSIVKLFPNYILINRSSSCDCLSLKNICNYSFQFNNGEILLKLVLIKNEKASFFIPSDHAQSEIENALLSIGRTYPLSKENEASIIESYSRNDQRVVLFTATVRRFSGLMVLITSGFLVIGAYISFRFLVSDHEIVIMNCLCQVAIYWVLFSIMNRFLNSASIRFGLKCNNCNKLPISRNGLKINVIASKAHCCPHCGQNLFLD